MNRWWSNVSARHTCYQCNLGFWITTNVMEWDYIFLYDDLVQNRENNARCVSSTLINSNNFVDKIKLWHFCLLTAFLRLVLGFIFVLRQHVFMLIFKTLYVLQVQICIIIMKLSQLSAGTLIPIAPRLNYRRNQHLKPFP